MLTRTLRGQGGEPLGGAPPRAGGRWGMPSTVRAAASQTTWTRSVPGCRSTRAHLLNFADSDWPMLAVSSMQTVSFSPMSSRSGPPAPMSGSWHIRSNLPHASPSVRQPSAARATARSAQMRLCRSYCRCPRRFGRQSNEPGPRQGASVASSGGVRSSASASRGMMSSCGGSLTAIQSAERGDAACLPSTAIGKPGSQNPAPSMSSQKAAFGRAGSDGSSACACRVSRVR